MMRRFGSFSIGLWALGARGSARLLLLPPGGKAFRRLDRARGKRLDRFAFTTFEAIPRGAGVQRRQR